MEFHSYPLGPLGTNCYLLSGDGKQAVLIDPAENAPGLLRELRRLSLGLEAIFLTHGHYDHLGAVDELVREMGAKVYLHPADEEILPHMGHGLLNVATQAYKTSMHVAGLDFTVYHTPGHSPGSICLQAEGLLFTGDTLFFGSCGRVDFQGGSWEKMKASLAFLAGLEGDLEVFPGHGESSTLETERKYNPYIREAMKA